jgi:hypothetical protein
MTEEEQRAADYRAQCVARRAFIVARSQALAAPLANAQAVMGAWVPTLGLGSQYTVCDDPTLDSEQLGQLTSGGPVLPPSPGVERLRRAVR